MTPQDFQQLAPQEQMDTWASLSEPERKAIRDYQLEQKAIREAAEKAKSVKIAPPEPPKPIPQPKPEPIRVIVTDLDISFEAMIGLICKWFLATLVVALIIGIPLGILAAILSNQ